MCVFVCVLVLGSHDCPEQNSVVNSPRTKSSQSLETISTGDCSSLKELQNSLEILSMSDTSVESLEIDSTGGSAEGNRSFQELRPISTNTYILEDYSTPETVSSSSSGETVIEKKVFTTPEPESCAPPSDAQRLETPMPPAYLEPPSCKRSKLDRLRSRRHASCGAHTHTEIGSDNQILTVPAKP